MQVLVFDVNETLLDLRALDAEFERVFGDARVRGMWFNQLIQNAMVSVITDAYLPFGVIGEGALSQVAARFNVTLSPQDRAQIPAMLKTAPPHPEVRRALEQLRGAGFRLCALTNNAQAVADAQLQNAGIAPFFEKILSCDTVKRLKPSPAPYRFAANEMNVPISRMCMIAAHAWDVTGAMRAGATAAFVARPGMTLDPLAPPPDMIGSDMQDVAEQLIAKARLTK